VTKLQNSLPEWSQTNFQGIFGFLSQVHVNLVTGPRVLLSWDVDRAPVCVLEQELGGRAGKEAWQD
jgi:hypothetical protein